jgi:hypothetical protein
VCACLTASLSFAASSDLELQERLVGTWTETRLLEGERHDHAIALRADGSFEITGVQQYLADNSSTKFLWRGKWGVKNGMFWYVTAFSDPPDLFPVGERLEDRIVFVSKSEWVMIEQTTGNESRARRLR